MKILCIIPARSGSKSIKDKNLKKIAGKSLIERTIIFSKKLNFLDKIIFTSDSYLYNKKVKNLKIECLLRPKKLSSDNSLMIDLIKYVLKKEKKMNHISYDYILLLQPTSPFRKLNDFVKAYHYLKDKKADSVITISEVQDHPDRMMKFKKNFLVNYNKDYSFKNKQKLDKIYIRSGSMYFFRKKNLNKYSSILGKKVKGVIVKDKYKINIDSMSDYISAKNLVNYK